MIELTEDLGTWNILQVGDKYVEPGHGSWTVTAKRDGVIYLDFVTEDGNEADEVHWSWHQRLKLYDDSHVVRAQAIIEEDPL